MTKETAKEIEMGDKHVLEIDKERSIEKSRIKKQLGFLLIVVAVIFTLVLCFTLNNKDKDDVQKFSVLSDEKENNSAINSLYANLGERCEGFDETTGQNFPSCGPGMKCKNTAEISIPGAGNTCVINDGIDDISSEELGSNAHETYANLGEACKGFDEITGKPYPSCGPGMYCKSTNKISILGAGSKCAIKDNNSNTQEEYSALNEKCDGFDETTEKPYPSCGPGMKCESTNSGFGLPGAGKKCVMDDDNNGQEEYANLGQPCEGFDEKAGKPYPSCGPGMKCEATSVFGLPGGNNECVTGNAQEETSENTAVYAGLGEPCGGFDEINQKPFPKCGTGMKCDYTDQITIPGAGMECVMDDDNSATYASLGEPCEGFDEINQKPFPSCGPGMKCDYTDELTIPGAGMECVMNGGNTQEIDEDETYAKVGETCEGYDENTGMSFPFCGPGMKCEYTSDITIPGAGKECVIMDDISTRRKRNLKEYADLGETCEGFDESIGMSFPRCREGLICDYTSEITIPGAGKACVMDDSTRRKRNLEEHADLGEACGGFDEMTGKSYPNCRKGLICEESAEISIPGAGKTCTYPSN